MKKTVFILTLISIGYSGFSQNVSQLLGGYLNVKNALVNSDSKAAADAALLFQKAISIESDFAQKKALLAAVDKMVKANSLEGQRTALAEVSPLLWKAVRQSDAVQNEVYYEYCPMKKAYWLSTEPAIKNPYYGSAMLTCGKVSETKK